MQNTKIKILLILGIPILLLGLWLAALFNILFSSKHKANILENPSKNSISSDTKTTNPNTTPSPTTSPTPQAEKKEQNDIPSNQSQTSSNSNIQKSNKLTILKIYLPKKFYTIGRKKIQTNLRKHNIILKIVYDLDDKKLLRDLALGKIDIALIPTTKLKKFMPVASEIQTKKTNFNTIFHYVFNDLLNTNKTQFIPYCIDPSASLTAPDIDLKNSSLASIKSYFITYPNKISPITVNLGLDKLISKIYLRKYKYPYDNFKDSLYILLYYSALESNPNIIQTLIDWSTKKYIKLFSSTTLIKYQTKLKNCNSYLDICLAKAKRTKIILGFLSDINYLKNWKAHSFPEAQDIYFVKGWGFIISKKTKNLQTIPLFLKEYIGQGTNGNYQLRNNCLSAFNNIYEKQKYIEKYSAFTNYEENFVLLTDTEEKLNNIFRNTKFLDAIEGKYSFKALYNNTNGFIDIVLQSY